MSRVFDAMRRQRAIAVDQPAAPHGILDSFPIREVTLPGPEVGDSAPAPEAPIPWSLQAPGDDRAATLRDPHESKAEKSARSFRDLIRDIARDEEEQGS